MRAGRFSIPVRLAAAFAVAVMLAAGGLRAAEAREAAYVMDATSGEALYAMNADTQNYPASLTKMMTLYLVFERLESGRLALGDKLPVSRQAAKQPASKIGLKAGSSISVKEAILALVIKSANDVATVVAEALGGTEADFARMMTAKARSLGMTSTVFKNASGLPNKSQFSSAHDMALLALALYRDFPQYYGYFSAAKATVAGVTIYSHNRMLKNYAGADGLKTGYTSASGFNIAVSVERGGRRLIGVVFGGKSAKERDKQMARLLDRSFAELEARTKFALDRVRPELKPGTYVAGTIVQPAVLASLEKAGADRTARLAVVETEVSVVYGIQVGAYGSVDTAANALQSAAFAAGDVLSPAAAALVPVEKGGGTLYRARYLGLTEAEAEEACRMLARDRLPCAVVRQSEKTVHPITGS